MNDRKKQILTAGVIFAVAIIMIAVGVSCVGNHIQISDLNTFKIQSDGEGPLRFLVVADIHQDIIYDAKERVKKIKKTLETNPVDFVIQLGDFTEPSEDPNAEVITLYNGLHKNALHVLGNHDMDCGSKQEVMEYWKMPANYYFFDVKGYRMIVLDCNFFTSLSGNPVHYRNGNYYAHPESRGTLPQEQQEWLKKAVEEAPGKVMLFSHQSIINPKSMANGTEIQALLQEINKNTGNKIVASFNGHEHIDVAETVENIHYIQINSSSYQWVGEDFKSSTRFSPELHEKYPVLENIVAYEEALFGIITVLPDEIQLKGVTGDFIGGFSDSEKERYDLAYPHLPISSSISDKVFPIK